MTNQQFLKNVARPMILGYSESPTGTDKILPLHGTLGNSIEKILGPQYKYYGLGSKGNDGEKIIKEGRLSYTADCTFENSETNTKRGIIECKAPFSSVKKNFSNNILHPAHSIAQIVRTKGYQFAFFIMLPNKTPLFTKEGILIKFEETGEHVFKKLKEISEADLSKDGSVDLICLCHYSLDSFDYEAVKTKEDYENMLRCYRGPISFKKINDAKSTKRLFFNDPSGFMQQFASLIKSGKKITTESQLVSLFLELPREVQVKFLEEQGKLPKIPSYVH